MARVTPYSLEAEKSILGSILLRNDCLRQVAGMIDALDFYVEAHREVFRTMLSFQLQRHKAIDLVTLTQRLKDSGKLEAVGGGGYLYELSEATPTAANVSHYCRIVKEKAAARRLIDYATNLAEKAARGGELPQIMTDARDGLMEIAGALDGLNGVSVADILPFEARQERYTAFAKSIEASRFKTGFGLLDREIRGVAPGEVLTAIAYSGTFKTAFLQNLLLRGVEATGLYHLFFSLEMPVEKVFEREMQIQGGVTGRDVERHYTGDRESGSIQAGINRWGSHGLLICDRPRLTLEKIGRYVDIAHQKYGQIGAVGVDYLGLIQAPGKTLYEKTAHIAIEAKNLAKEMNVPVLLLCQINRAAATNGGEIETHAAKGGGDVEAAADFMLGFQIETGGQLTCRVLKNRNGATGAKFEVEIDRDTLQFRDMIPFKPEPSTAKSKRNIPF